MAHFSAFNPRLSAIFLAVGIYVRSPRAFIPTMTVDKVDGTPPTDNLGTVLTSPNEHDLPTVVTTNSTPHQKYPIRVNIHMKNRDQDVNPFAVIKALLAEFNKHDPSALLGDHGEVFYSLQELMRQTPSSKPPFMVKPRKEKKPSSNPFSKNPLETDLLSAPGVTSAQRSL